ncbi:hypothetical protein V6615_03730 [Oscillospiraceae bacterium PP1C4]
MLKKIMLYLMMLGTACKFLALTFVFSTDIERLPTPIYISTGIVVLFGVFLICKNIIKSVNKKELGIYYVLLCGSVVFNLIFMKLFSRTELTTMDLIIIGTIMDIVVNVTLITLSVRENRYVRICVKSDN